MKALTSACSIAALLASLIVLPGCGGGDEAAPPPAGGAAMEPMPGDDLMLEDTGDAGLMEGAPAEYDTDADVEPAAP